MHSTDTTTAIETPQKFGGSLQSLVLLCAVALAAGWGVSHWIEASGSASYVGLVQTRTTTVVAEHPGRMASVKVATGQRVTPGEILFELSDARLSELISAKQRELMELEAEVQRVKATADVELEWRRRDLQNEVFQTQLKAASINQEKLSRQVEQLAWQDQLKSRENGFDQKTSLVTATSPFHPVIVNSNAVDERRLQAMLKEDAAAGAVESLSHQLNLCEQQLNRLKKLDEELPSKIRLSIGVDLAEARLKRAREELASYDKQRESLTVYSPSHGTIGGVHRETDDLVKPGDIIVELFDDDRHYLTASIPSSIVAKLEVGSKVKLVFPAGHRRIGLVAAIPPRAMPERAGDSSNDSLVAVKIEPAGRLWPKIPIGSRVRVQVP